MYDDAAIIHHGRSAKEFARSSLLKILVSLFLIVLYIVFAAHYQLEGDLQLGFYIASIPVFGMILLWRCRSSIKQIEQALYIRRFFGLAIIILGANLIHVADSAYQVRVLFMYPFIYFIYVNEFTTLDRVKFLVFIACGHIGVFLLPTDFSNQVALSLIMLFASAFGFDTIKLRDANTKLTRELEHKAKSAIHQLSHFDSLTGLPNQLSLNELVRGFVDQSNPQTQAAAVIAIGIDRFKAVNETLGHLTGDQILVEVARRLNASLKANEVLIRFNGDQFHLTILNNTSTTYLQSRAKEIHAAFLSAIDIADHPIALTASLGIATKTSANEGLDELQRSAELAMNEAKLADNVNTFFFDSNMNRQAQDRFLIESELRLAKDELQQFELFFQPICQLNTNKISGAEALLRWHNPKLGNIAPDRFIPIAEITGLIIPLGYWVLEQAISTLATLNAKGIALPSIGVNLSAGQLHAPDLIERIKDLLARYPAVNPKQIDIELTERTVMSKPEEGINMLNQLKTLGLTLSIDDYGVAYSSLNYLKRLPANCLKIDKSFITELANDQGDQAIVASTIILAHQLGLDVLAEGVEDEQQREILAALSCDEIQGYGFARPMPAAEFERFLSQHSIANN